MATPSNPAISSVRPGTTDPRAAVLRALAARVVVEVAVRGLALDAAIAGVLDAAAVAGRDRAMVQELSFGVLRWYGRLQGYLKALLRRPLKDKDRDIGALLLIGLYQLEHLRIPAHAAVSETVAACGELSKPWAKGLVNGVLRSYQRRAGELANGLDEAARVSHPQWLLEAIRTEWPREWRDIVVANNERPPMTLRVNLRHQDRQEYLERLARAGVTAGVHRDSATAVVLAQPVPVHSLPGFDAGRASVQDVAAQWAAPLMDLAPGQRVLDACAAPGGKTAHMLELEPALAEVLALDISAERCTRIRENLTRLGLRAEVLTADAADTDAWWDGVPFDRILLDAPCSGSGVIRRHPDIKLLRRRSDMTGLAERQHRLLARLFPLLKAGGRMLYATCSIFAGENDARLLDLFRERSDAMPLPIEVPGATATRAGVQLLPGVRDGDGFYYAAAVRAATGA